MSDLFSSHIVSFLMARLEDLLNIPAISCTVWYAKYFNKNTEQPNNAHVITTFALTGQYFCYPLTHGSMRFHTSIEDTELLNHIRWLRWFAIQSCRAAQSCRCMYFSYKRLKHITFPKTDGANDITKYIGISKQTRMFFKYTC